MLKVYELPSNNLIYDSEMDILGASLPQHMICSDSKIFLVTEPVPSVLAAGIKQEEAIEKQSLSE